MHLADYLPHCVNSGPWLTTYTLPALQQSAASADIVLPICSLGTRYADLARLGELVLPPLFHEALDPTFKARMLDQINRCFPAYRLTPDDHDGRERIRLVELPPRAPPRVEPPRVLAFSVDTAVEEHGPHLPLATDTIQSYAVLTRLAAEFERFVPGPPIEYGQLTWGLPFGFSIDITAELLTEYVRRFTDAVLEWLRPEAVYVVDVHGSLVHRSAIVAGLEQSRAERWLFRWLHEPLAEFASQRGDQHAGGVETALVEHVSRDLLAPEWWPDRIDEIAAGQMPLAAAVELAADLSQFIECVARNRPNGIVGDIRNYHRVDAAVMLDRMLGVARADVEALLDCRAELRRSAGECLW
jgi:creatinine amidohydrolase